MVYLQLETAKKNKWKGWRSWR